MVQTLGREFELSLPQSQNAPVGPSARLAWRELRESLKLGLRPRIVTDQISGQTDTEC